MQLWVPCNLGVRLCHMNLPGISEYVCKGAYAYCLATQARYRRPRTSCCTSCQLRWLLWCCQLLFPLVC